MGRRLSNHKSVKKKKKKETKPLAACDKLVLAQFFFFFFFCVAGNQHLFYKALLSFSMARADDENTKK